MTTIQPAALSDRELIDATGHAVDCERRATAELLVLLAELDTRKLYLGEGCASLFAYCTQRLHLSEAAAYSRITAARAIRRFPQILDLLADGEITLTTIGLLASHLTDETVDALLDASRHKSKRDVERFVACLYPQPDLPATVRKLAAPVAAGALRLPPSDVPAERHEAIPASAALVVAPAASALSSRPVPPRSLVAPIAADRYLLKVTLSREAHDDLERARALLRHAIPNGDPAAVIARALAVLVEELEKQKIAATSRPRTRPSSPTTTRHVPAHVRRTVWARDRGRCAFIGSGGRCEETSFLEFHHVHPFAEGGKTDVGNLQLRCRAHNAYEAQLWFGTT